MSDRHLCKAKTAILGKWVEGSLVIFDDEHQMIVPVGYDQAFTYPELIEMNAVSIDPSTICQCTGLKDKNGKLIWENDIVKAIYKPKGGDLAIDNFIIKWDKYKCAYVGYYSQKENVYNPLLFGSQTSFEVIGNIFDNPSLLEGGAEC